MVLQREEVKQSEKDARESKYDTRVKISLKKTQPYLVPMFSILSIQCCTFTKTGKVVRSRDERVEISVVRKSGHKQGE